MQRRQLRKGNGSVLPIAISLMLIIAILGVGLSHLILTMGAANQVQNAVNEGALRIGQQVLTVTEQPKVAQDLDQFEDIAWTKDGKPHFTLANVNRAMAKAMIVAANYADMHERHMDDPIALTHAQDMEKSAKKISDSVKQEILDHSKNLDQEFHTFANSNTLRMANFKSEVQPRKEQWDVAYMDAGVESNIWLNKNVLPGGQQNKFVTVPNKDGKSYIQGYQSHKLTQLRMVPFRKGERPALISGTKFNANKTPSVATDLPNAFACKGSAMSRQGHNINSVAMVQSNPQQQFEMRPKDGWIRVVLHSNDVDFFLSGFKVRTDHYGHRPAFSSDMWFGIPIAAVKISATCGQEYIPPSVWSCLFPKLCWGDATPQSNLVQRLRELRPDLSDDQLKAPLQNTYVNLTSRGDQVFYVFLDKNDNITVRPEGSGDIPKTVRKWAKPDGQSQGCDQKYAWVPNFPNFSSATIYGVPFVRVVTWCFLKGGVNWIPSTGYNGCLGQIEHKNTTLCHTVILPKGPAPTSQYIPEGASITSEAVSPIIPPRNADWVDVPHTQN